MKVFFAQIISQSVWNVCIGINSKFPTLSKHLSLNKTRSLKLPPRLKNITHNSKVSTEQHFASFNSIVVVETTNYNVEWSEIGPDMVSQLNPYMATTWPCYDPIYLIFNVIYCWPYKTIQRKSEPFHTSRSTDMV